MPELINEGEQDAQQNIAESSTPFPNRHSPRSWCMVTGRTEVTHAAWDAATTVAALAYAVALETPANLRGDCVQKLAVGS
ncbi:MAG: hypothetical protein ACRDTH_17420 [Pseudonocardiaceae bacterium]